MGLGSPAFYLLNYEDLHVQQLGARSWTSGKENPSKERGGVRPWGWWRLPEPP